MCRLILWLLFALGLFAPSRSSASNDERLIFQVQMAEEGTEPYAKVIAEVAREVQTGGDIRGTPFGPDSSYRPLLNLLKLLIKARDYQNAMMLLRFGVLNMGPVQLRLQVSTGILDAMFFRGLEHPESNQPWRTGCELDRGFAGYRFRRHRTPWGKLDVTLTDEEAFGFLLFLRQPNRATKVFQRAFADAEACLRTLRQSSYSEKAMAEYLGKLRWQEDSIYTLFLGSGEAQTALSVALLRKGRTLDEAADTSHSILRSLKTERERSDYARMRALKTEIAGLMGQASDGRSASDHQQTIETKGKEAAALEASLATRSSPLRSERLPDLDAVLSAVAKTLPEDGAFLEIAAAVPYEVGRSRPYMFAWERSEEWRSAAHYLAFVLLSDGTVKPSDLGPVAPIDAAVRDLRSALRGPLGGQTVEAAQQVHRLLLAPLKQALGERRRLWLSLDDQLHFVPMVALHDGQDYLLGRYEFTYLTSGRDLLRPAPQGGGPPSVVVLADPLFKGQRAPLPLPGTRAEATAVARLFPGARVLLSAAASKTALLGLSQAPGILHVATHGRYLTAKDQGDPLARSALELAAEGGDGRTTALELAALDLWGTQLVVLSACDTGLGESRRGQGVYGLRRAFFIAGAETLVTSLWQVEDQGTPELMAEFYGHLLRGTGRTQALTLAAQELRRRRPHPHFWAAFQALGSAAPLRLTAAPMGPPSVERTTTAASLPPVTPVGPAEPAPPESSKKTNEAR